jgi:arylsulfatase A-like enzyme
MTDEDTTVAQRLKALGYTTACIGKWGVGAPPPLDDPQQRGFDYFFGYISMWHSHNFYPEFLIRNGKRVALRNVVADRWQGQDGRGVAVKKVDYAPDLLMRDAVRFIEKNRDVPFFLYYALNVPHANNEGVRFSDAPEKGMEVPDFGPYADKDWPAPEKGFAAMMRNIDLDVGRILAKLKELDLDQKTIVMFSSDNGPHQEGGHKMEFFNSNGSLRGMKRDLFEGGLRVPLIVRWTGHVRSNISTDHLCGFQDILPTLVAAAGGEVPDGIDGISFLPTLLGDDASQRKHEYLYWEFSEQGGKRAIRKGPWKLVQLQMGKPKPAAPQLYHLLDDPSETTNLAEENPQLVQQLTALMEQAHTPSKKYPFTAAER